MGWSDKARTILHVEDDPLLASLVQASFKGFGFSGDIITASRVDEALDLLEKSARSNNDISLILVDMQLPDGLGLDLIREVKSSAAWKTTPIIVLSGETTPDTIDSAYALGANSYLPKFPKSKSPYHMLRSLYEFWLKDAFLPHAPPRDRLKNALDMAMRLRSRSADFYTRLAGVSGNDPEQAEFWLGLALNEGNLSNLMAFFYSRADENDISEEMLERLTEMQVQVRQALTAAEDQFRNKPTPTPTEICLWVLGFTDALNEEVIVEVLASLFPQGPAARNALKARASYQLKDLGNYVLKITEEAEVRQKAMALLDWGERLAAT